MMIQYLRYVGSAGVAAGIGALSSLFGIGGGPLLVPALTYLFALDFGVARGTSLALVSISGVLGLIERAWIQKLSLNQYFDSETFLIMAPFLAIGSLFLAWALEWFLGVQIEIEAERLLFLKRAFGACLVLIGLVIIARPS